MRSATMMVLLGLCSSTISSAWEPKYATSNSEWKAAKDASFSVPLSVSLVGKVMAKGSEGYLSVAPCGPTITDLGNSVCQSRSHNVWTASGTMRYATLSLATSLPARVKSAFLTAVVRGGGEKTAKEPLASRTATKNYMLIINQAASPQPMGIVVSGD